MKKHRGFSMIEVMVTIAIIGILMAAAMPSVGDWLRKARIRNTAESIQNGLQQARMEAVRRNRPVMFSLVTDLSSSCALSSASASWVVSVAAPAGKCDARPDLAVAPQLVAKAAVGDGGSASATVKAVQSDGSTAGTSVTFNGMGGLAQSSAATAIRRIDVTSPTKGDDGTYFVRRVEISSGGVGRMCDPNVADPKDSRACNP
ncbi:MAG: GspH/FimT family pseudopilin [Burkholderiales bacterium]|nr:GspH/FimT family pseudopilin [Burkholderiales bacterium]